VSLKRIGGFVTVGRLRVLASDVVLGGAGRIGGSVYGTVLVMAALTAAYPAERHHPWKLVELVGTACVVFWLAYVYAHALSESIADKRGIGRTELKGIADRELGIVLAAVVPVLALCLGATGLTTETASVWAAIALGLATLFVQGVRYARASDQRGVAFAAIVTANLSFGLMVVLLKVSLVH
jgi:hypothetical protein